ncbi:MAG TPA: hypothetical protein VFO33_08660, partial [Casimicrobiaceae bacterium]|nr:hypothetical protein [Casimicrobiaceae bacterium]
MVRRAFDFAGFRCRRALAWCFVAVCTVPSIADAASLTEKARESGCAARPISISGDLYKCTTTSGNDAFFNVPSANGGNGSTSSAPRRTDSKAVTSSSTPNTPTGFPRVDPETQKGRDDLRRKVLTDELTAEEKALADARIAYDGGAPAPLPEEKADAEKYRQRIARLREAVQLHQRNVEAL